MALTQIETYNIKGLLFNGITSGIKFNTNALPPTVNSGTYAIGDRAINFSADQTLSLSANILQQGKVTLDLNCQYVVAVNSLGDIAYSLYGESVVRSGSFTSMTGSGTTKTVLTSSATTADNGKILQITDNATNNGRFLITGVSNGVSYTIESIASTPGDSGGSFTVYEHISSLHGTGLAVAQTGTAIAKYTPSYGENGWPTSFIAWDSAKMGYYFTTTGLTDYRVIGNFRTNASSQVITDIVSHKTGRDKNDNEALLRDINASPTTGSTDTSVIRWNTITKCFGCDYTVVTTATAGTVVTSKRDGSASISLTTNLTNYYGINKNATQLTTEVDSMTDGSSLAYTIGIGIGAHNSISAITKMNSGDNIRSMTRNSIPATASERNTFVYVLIL